MKLGAEVGDEKCEDFELIDENLQSETDKLGVNESHLSETDELEANNTIVDQLLIEQQHLSTPMNPKQQKSGENISVDVAEVGTRVPVDDREPYQRR